MDQLLEIHRKVAQLPKPEVDCFVTTTAGVNVLRTVLLSELPSPKVPCQGTLTGLPLYIFETDQEARAAVLVLKWEGKKPMYWPGPDLNETKPEGERP
jgi:hypothetical protein